MSTLGSLMSLLGDTGIKPYNEQELTENRIRFGTTQNQTQLLELADLKRKQAAEQEMMAAIQQNPALAQQLFGGPVLGSLQTAPGGVGTAPMTQQTTMPGQPPGAPQVVPGGQDLSQFATQGGPPQSTLAGLGPQPHATQNPLLAMAQRDPRAAMMLQQQLEGRQEQQWKMEERRLDMGVKVAAGVAQELNAVKDQASLDAARERVRQYHPQAAAQIPQFYSKEALEPLIMKGVAVEKLATWRKDMATARHTEMMTERLPQVFGSLQQFATGGGTQAPQAEAPRNGAEPAAPTRSQAAPAAFEAAIADATRLYPQVSPARITSIIAAESNFNPKAVSSAGAQGPMQLMPGTAKDMGVEDPFDITQNVRGGTRYYAQLLTRYGGDERKALTAYNWGPGNLDKVGGDVSKAPAETQAYVRKVLDGGGGGRSTTQAPRADAKMSQLDAQIKQGQALALQLSAVPGMEQAATMVNQQVNDLQKQRDRLEDRSTEIPRAVAKETAITQAKTDLERQRQAGPMLPEDRRKLLTGLRTDIRAEPTFKLYQDVRNGYQNVRIGAETDSGQGDLAIINGMAKILDPNSTVMSGEARNVETAQGELERWFNSPQRFFTGDRLTPENRQRFLRLAHAMAKEKLATARTELTSVYEPLAKEGNIQFSQLLPLEDLKPLGAGPNVSKFEKLLSP